MLWQIKYHGTWCMILNYISWRQAITIVQGDYEITAKLIKKNELPLYAPVNGTMNRVIHESASCKAYFKFTFKGKLLCEFTSSAASFEFE